MDLPSLFFFSIEAMKRNSFLVLPSKQRLNKLHFLQKLGCQKPCWDQARLSSLVNKQVGGISDVSNVTEDFKYCGHGTYTDSESTSVFSFYFPGLVL